MRRSTGRRPTTPRTSSADSARMTRQRAAPPTPSTATTVRAPACRRSSTRPERARRPSPTFATVYDANGRLAAEYSTAPPTAEGGHSGCVPKCLLYYCPKLDEITLRGVSIRLRSTPDVVVRISVPSPRVAPALAAFRLFSRRWQVGEVEGFENADCRRGARVAPSLSLRNALRRGRHEMLGLPESSGYATCSKLLPAGS